MRIFSYEELDELGEGLIRQYLGKEAERTCCVDIEGFVTDFLKLPLLYRSFAEEDSDKIGFIADGVTPLRVYEGGSTKAAGGASPSATSAPTTSWTGQFPAPPFTVNLTGSAPTRRRTSKTCSAFGRRRLTAWVLLS